ncbi:hypothetical protein CQA66_08230 [Helicobacter aurati]|uniref:Uncharacterized protein n=1 Tax=Helicobacter aurati TaxID=137778 RepID=A0A3D8IZQ4_9HELI|nr:hypothetical protein [Helicobacter aurati]RDU70385.1 hypothetical protein CQA66_08230 [Helicobacter aurati]
MSDLKEYLDRIETEIRISNMSEVERQKLRDKSDKILQKALRKTKKRVSKYNHIIVTTKDNYFPISLIAKIGNTSSAFRQKVYNALKKQKIQTYEYYCDFTKSSCICLEKKDLEKAKVIINECKKRIYGTGIKRIYNLKININETYNGKLIKDILEEKGINDKILRKRIYAGWNFDDALNTEKYGSRSRYHEVRTNMINIRKNKYAKLQKKYTY